MSLLDRLRGDPRERFAKQVLAKVRDSGVSRAWYDPEQFAIGYECSPGDKPGWVFLNNCFAECEGADAEETRQRIDRLVDTVVNTPELPQTWDAARGTLRPVLRAATFGMGAPAGAQPIVRRPALPYVDELIVIDTPRSMAYVTQESLAGWGVGADTAYAAAHANLAAMLSAEPKKVDADGTPRLLRFVDDGDAYFASRILLDGWLAGLAGEVGGRPVAFVPENNTLIVAPDRPEHMASLLELVESQFSEAPRAISPQPYTVDGNGVLIVYPVDDGHPAAAAVRRAAAMLESREYNGQKHWLDKAGVSGAFVATHNLAQRPDGTVFSYAVWPAGEETLLPKADFIGFAEDASRTFFVPLADLRHNVRLDPADDLNPQRFRVNGWPDQSTMDILRTLAVTP
jgi:hypothetical protein